MSENSHPLRDKSMISNKSAHKSTLSSQNKVVKNSKSNFSSFLSTKIVNSLKEKAKKMSQARRNNNAKPLCPDSQQRLIALLELTAKLEV
jgi:hypothetical protein